MSKYFIVTAGVTGSGKSSLIDKTKKYLQIPHEEELSKILIDDLIEQDPKYKKKVKGIISAVQNDCQENTECIRNKYTTPESTLLKKFENAYFETRRSHGCLSNTEDITIPTCDELNDEILKASIENRKHIVLETTGGYIPKWILNHNWIPSEYTIVFSYTLVSLENLILRNKSRAYKGISNFQKNDTNPAPRFPDCSREELEKKVTHLKNVLIDLYSSCVFSHDVNKCGTSKINRLLVFDNNNSLHIIFDSNDNNKGIDQFISTISSALYTNGGRKSNKKKTKYKTIKRKTIKRKTIKQKTIKQKIYRK